MRNNPESEENQQATKQNEREVFALKMMHNAAIEESNALDHCDLMMDELERIKAIVSNYSEFPYSSEIKELCVRAIENTKQRVPVVAQLRTNQSQLAKAITALRGNKRGIYTASKVKHAAIWRHYRDQGFPIISTWIDEAEEGESSSYEELSVRCIEEAKSAQILMLFCEDEEILKGALIEAGAALASNVQIACIGDCPSLSRVFKEHPLWKEYASPAAFFYAHRHLIASTTLAELKGE
jgi:uncharacterized FlaG/YvyC family protein